VSALDRDLRDALGRELDAELGVTGGPAGRPERGGHTGLVGPVGRGLGVEGLSGQTDGLALGESAETGDQGRVHVGLAATADLGDFAGLNDFEGPLVAVAVRHVFLLFLSRACPDR